MRYPQSGFTLIELMVTLSIVAILLSLSAPLRDMVMNNRRAASVNEFIAALNFTRNEAITRGQRVSICRSLNQTSCANGTGWEDGWIIFLDSTTRGVIDNPAPWNPAPPPASGDVLKIHGPVNAATLRGNATVVDSISFSAGGSAFDSNGTVMVCDARGLGSSPNYFARRVVIAPAGRTRTVKPKPADGSSCP